LVAGKNLDPKPATGKTAFFNTITKKTLINFGNYA